jgi:hypothetical protein
VELFGEKYHMGSINKGGGCKLTFSTGEASVGMAVSRSKQFDCVSV